MKSFASTSVHWKPPTVLHGLVLLLLAVCVAGQSLQFAPNSSELRADSGRRVVIQCVLNGNTVNGASYTWTGPALNSNVMGHTSITQSMSGTVSTLTINNVGSDDAGQYSCSYAGIQIFITLVVVVQPSFLSVQENQKFPEGTDAVVLCPASFGSNLLITMLWFRDDVLVTNLGDQFIPGDGQLTIQNARIEDSGEYQCSLIRDGTAVIDQRTIQVEVLPRSAFAPKINDSVRVINVSYRDPLNLPCPLEVRRENDSYSWIIDTKFEVNILEDTRATLHREAGKFVSGRYTCEVENKYGDDVADFIVNIEAPPLPSECAISIQTITPPEKSVVLKPCDLTSPVQPSELTFSWTKNGTAIAIQSGGRFSINHFGLLTIENTTSSDLGIYQVNISNAIGTAVHKVKLS